MVNKIKDANTISDFNNLNQPRRTKLRRGRASITVVFPDSLFDSIYKEALKREWTLAHTVRHLCEASIDGIE